MPFVRPCRYCGVEIVTRSQEDAMEAGWSKWRKLWTCPKCLPSNNFRTATINAPKVVLKAIRQEFVGTVYTSITEALRHYIVEGYRRDKEVLQKKELLTKNDLVIKY